jgi:hypothetical protein
MTTGARSPCSGAGLRKFWPFEFRDRGSCTASQSTRRAAEVEQRFESAGSRNIRHTATVTGDGFPPEDQAIGHHSAITGLSLL